MTHITATDQQMNIQNNYEISVKHADERWVCVLVDWGIRIPGDKQGTNGLKCTTIQAATESEALDNLRVALGQGQASRRLERHNDKLTDAAGEKP